MASLNDDSDDQDLDLDDEHYTDTDLFDPEAIARELESSRRAIRRSSSSARNRIEEMLERKRLERELLDYEYDGEPEEDQETGRQQ